MDLALSFSIMRIGASIVGNSRKLIALSLSLSLSLLYSDSSRESSDTARNGGKKKIDRDNREKGQNRASVTGNVARSHDQAEAPTCDFPLAHSPPQRFRLAHRPVLHFRAEATEEFVLFEVRHPSAAGVPSLVDVTGSRRGVVSTIITRHIWH